MEPLINLKRPTGISYSLCIICQEDKGGELRDASSQGLQRIAEVTQVRKKLRDNKYRDVIDRLEVALSDQTVGCLVWHKNCYAQYTDKGKLQRLESQSQRLLSCTAGTSSSSSAEPGPARKGSSSSRRSLVQPVDWNACIFCQKNDSKQRLISVTTFKMSHQILEAAPFDLTVSVRLAGINDLIAAEAKYHLICYSRFVRSTAVSKRECSDTDLPMVWLLSELQYSADQGHVLELSSVWDRYCALTEEANVAIPQSYVSRRSSFKQTLMSKTGDLFDFIIVQDGCLSDGKTLLMPTKYKHVPISELANTGYEDEPLIPVYQPQEDIFMSLVHVALKLRADIMAHPGHQGFNVSEEDAAQSIPDALYMFLKLLYEGQSVLDSEPDEDEDNVTKTRILSVGQDLVYGVSKGKKLTPKHIGLGSTLHQATRSKQLVQLFHSAGHTVSYQSVLQIDTALAEKTLSTMDPISGAVIPPNLMSGKFIHFTADNIDINDSSLNGKNTFHATQMAVWQRGPAQDILLKDLKPSKNRTLEVPQAMDELASVDIPKGHVDMPFYSDIQKEWFNKTENDQKTVIEAREKDMAFILIRQTMPEKPSWSHFNKDHTTENPEITTVGYMPIIQAPAHEMDTLNTVVQRCLHVASSLGQSHVVLTVDQALYCKLMELKWTIPQYKDKLIPRLGGLHTAMNFLKVIGQHMQASGLADLWVESNTLGTLSTEKVLEGKSYSRGIRVHKLTFQALWQLLLPQLMEYLGKSDEALKQDIEDKHTSDRFDELVTLLGTERFRESMSTFATQKCDADVNFKFWWQYMEMVVVLLMFTRAQRDGIWELHLYSFQCMLPFFLYYDHTNYARWGPVYLAEMHQLPDSVLQEFRQGNFVVKMGPQKFNQVDPDMSQEWMNAVGKKGGGIVGITKTASALSRWALSYNLRAHISASTREMFNVGLDDQMIHNEMTKARTHQDNEDEHAILDVLKRFNVFSNDTSPTVLQSIATKDLASSDIQQSLLNAASNGKVNFNRLLDARFLKQPGTAGHVKLHEPLKKTKALTFASLYDIRKVSKGTEKVLKADRNVLQRLITAYEAGRPVNLSTVLQHELMPVPLSLAQLDGSLRSGSKSLLQDLLTTDVACPLSVQPHGQSCLIIDGNALMQAIGKPHGAATFGDLANKFIQAVLLAGRQYSRTDVLFDRYPAQSIKGGTRDKRSKGSRPVRRVIESRDVPLPSNWASFVGMSENKKDLTCFLSEELIRTTPHDRTIVVAGGFVNEETVECTDPMQDVSNLNAFHEEADTRIIVHAASCLSDCIVVWARDTDVLVLLIGHFANINCRSVWMKAGTSKKPKFIPVHTIYERLTTPVVDALIPFHALTGSDTTSFLAGHSKKTAWKVLEDNCGLLSGLGSEQLTSEIEDAAESFVCKIYGLTDITKTDSARVILFKKGLAAEALPPTSNALHYHILRSHYQAKLWTQANVLKPCLPAPIGNGWKLQDEALVPELMSLSPIPTACLEVIFCACKTGCRSLRCKCRKSKLHCTGACNCSTTDMDCLNKPDD